MNHLLRHLLPFLLVLAVPLAAGAQEATIKKNLAERVPMLTHIDAVSETPVAGIYEIRVGNDILYSDATGDHLIQGTIIDTQTRTNLTQERIDELTAIAFKDLKLENAFPVVYGKGTRKMAAFEDPNCPYCKRLEKDLTQIDDVTIYTFLIPILGADSVKKAHQIWCSKDRADAWIGWMVDNRALEGDGDCDTSALDANLAFAQKYRITGTPTLVFTDGTRIPGAINAEQIEKLLAKAQ